MVRALLTPRMLLLHLLGAAATTAAILLGLWQLDVWQTGRDLEARDLAGATPRPLDEVITPDSTFPGDDVGRPVRFSGSWLPESTVLVADRELDGRTGVWAVTPVAVCARPSAACPQDSPAVLVVRGWAPAASAVPPPPDGEVTLTGWLQPGEGSGVPDPDPTDDVLSELRIASAIQHVDQDLYGGYVVAREGAPADGLTAITPGSLPKPSSLTSLQNLLYAVQWWLFAGFAVFIWQRWVRDELERGREAGPADGDDNEDAGRDAGPAEIASTP